MWYRIYQVDDHGHIRAAKDVECACDVEAVAAGRAAVNWQGVEVWQGARRLAVLPAETTAVGESGLHRRPSLRAPQDG